MSKYLQILKSRTVWSCIVIVLINGIPAVQNQIPSDYLSLVNGLLALLAAFFRVNPRVSFQ